MFREAWWLFRYRLKLHDEMWKYTNQKQSFADGKFLEILQYSQENSVLGFLVFNSATLLKRDSTQLLSWEYYEIL